MLRPSGRRRDGSGARQAAAITDRVTKNGAPKLVQRCTLPLTGVGCVTCIYTSLAVIDIGAAGFVLREKRLTISLETLQSLTGARLHLQGPVIELTVPEVG